MHTQGRWIVKRDELQEQRRLTVRVDDETGEAIAQVWGINEEAQANASLIAAAPELLEAAWQLDAMVSKIGCSPAFWDEMHALRDAIRAAGRVPLADIKTATEAA